MSQAGNQDFPETRILPLVANARYAEGETLFREECRTRSEAFGEDSNDAHDNMQALGLLLHMQGQNEGAEEQLRKAVDGRQRNLGAWHFKTLRSSNSLGEVLLAQGKVEDAVALLRPVFESFDIVDEQSLNERLKIMDVLARTLELQGLFQDAEVLGQRMVAEAGMILGHDHIDTLIYCHSLAGVLSKQGKALEAVEMFERAYSGTSLALGAQHPDTQDFLKDYEDSKRAATHNSMCCVM